MLRISFLAVAGLLGVAACAVAPSEETPAAEIAQLSSSTIDDLMPMATGRTYSSRTPMGIHFESAAEHVVTAAEAAFLADAAEEPPIPPSASWLHLAPFQVELYPNGAPSPADVEQHAVGDCSAAAVMGSLAYVNSGFIQRIIDDHGDGTFGVHVFDPSGRPLVINVDSQFMADNGNSVGGVSGQHYRADWATVLEKTITKYLAVYPVVRRIGGIGSEFASPIFTGNGDSFGFDPGRLTASQITRAARVSLAHGKLVVGGFNVVMPLETIKTVTLHAYTVMVPDSSSTLLSMRNPWGTSPKVGSGYDPSHDGVIDVPATAVWSSAVDMRIMEPGAAAGPGATGAWSPPAL